MPGRYPRLLTLRTLVSARFSTSIRHLAAIFRVTSDSRKRDQEGRSEAKEKERREGGWGKGGRRISRGETIAFSLAGFLSSYRNSIDTETNFIPRWRNSGRIRGIGTVSRTLEALILDVPAWNFFAQCRPYRCPRTFFVLSTIGTTTMITELAFVFVASPSALVCVWDERCVYFPFTLVFKWKSSEMRPLSWKRRGKI